MAIGKRYDLTKNESIGSFEHFNAGRLRFKLPEDMTHKAHWSSEEKQLAEIKKEKSKFEIESIVNKMIGQFSSD